MDIKDDDLLMRIADDSIIGAFPTAEMEHPPLHGSLGSLQFPKSSGDAVLSGFGAVVRGDEKRNRNAQPSSVDRASSPEVVLMADWSYPIDIGNVGAMIWDLFEGKTTFRREDPDGEGYSARAHFAEIIGNSKQDWNTCWY
ncbi:protein kinase [Drepanopeziza brunnea f. sp. 'multigermtubi' MB_m1]|uniref:Protein kinase n=1 Tax=Marssonina brunnea f. sp. multigermtubi (strain MB_m1) TaxID=1072389 RepID=K1W7M8_MARBU|nr:protein kinase [Drepanopeziza brunnea f. sp. 'multigermtubi' MB_m1]EKD13100.1 protein kinase [Drepanopeziza brunnea f. sp. 'multigermtubi' MB_m1]